MCYRYHSIKNAISFEDLGSAKRVEDALYATRAAVEAGVLPVGGRSLSVDHCWRSAVPAVGYRSASEIDWAENQRNGFWSDRVACHCQVIGGPRDPTL